MNALPDTVQVTGTASLIKRLGGTVTKSKLREYLRGDVSQNKAEFKIVGCFDNPDLVGKPINISEALGAGVRGFEYRHDNGSVLFMEFQVHPSGVAVAVVR